MIIVPVTFRQACAIVQSLHRHHKPPRGHKFSIGVQNGDGLLCGVAMVGRPVARAFDNGTTAEVIRTCTDGTRNANSMLYGAARKAAFAMGYRRILTYIEEGETGASLRAAGWWKVKDLPPRGNWAASTKDERLKAMRDVDGRGGVARQLWEWKA